MKEESISPVEIIAYREQSYLSKLDTYTADSTAKFFFGQTNLSDLLQRCAPVIINNYGSGNASISIHGTNDDHTLVLWNGIPINSISLGSMDISLLPAAASENVQVSTNAGANIFGSGTFGGALLLDEKIGWKKTQSVSVRSDLLSFNGYQGDLHMRLGNPTFQFRSNIFYQNARNDFLYIDSYKFNHPEDTIAHNSMWQAGAVHTLHWKINTRNFITAGNWFQWKEKDIPGIMGSYQPSSKFQRDVSTRSFIKYNYLFSHAQLQISTAHVYDYLIYTDKFTPTDTFLLINSNLKSNRLLNAVSYRHYFKNIRFDVAADLNFVQAKVSEYGKTVQEFQGAVFSGIFYQYQQLQIDASVRQEIRSGKYIRPLFGISAGWTSKNKYYTAEISYADKYHAPDFNDKYWMPGGNPDLLPEEGFTTAFNQQFRLQQHKKNELLLRLNVYATKIKEEIIWVPVSGTVWSPENLQSALHYGADIQLNYSRTLHSGKIGLQLIYLFNRSLILENDQDPSIRHHFIAYRPQHSLKSNLYYQNEFFTGGINYCYIGKRYTDKENIEAFSLPAYGLLDLYASFSVPVKPMRIEVLLRINNILDVSYQSVRSYAQPGRSLTFSIILNVHKSPKNED